MRLLKYLCRRLCTTLASFRNVRSAISSAFSNLGGFILLRSSVATFRILPSPPAVKLTMLTAPPSSSLTTQPLTYPCSLSDTQTYFFEANSAAAAASAAVAPTLVALLPVPPGRSRPAAGLQFAPVFVRANCAMFADLALSASL